MKLLTVLFILTSSTLFAANGTVMTRATHKNSLGVAIFGRAAEHIYKSLDNKLAGASTTSLIPKAKITSGGMECTFNEKRSSPYQCAFTLVRGIKSVPGL